MPKELKHIQNNKNLASFGSIFDRKRKQCPSMAWISGILVKRKFFVWSVALIILFSFSALSVYADDTSIEDDLEKANKIRELEAQNKYLLELHKYYEGIVKDPNKIIFTLDYAPKWKKGEGKAFYEDIFGPQLARFRPYIGKQEFLETTTRHYMNYISKVGTKYKKNELADYIKTMLGYSNSLKTLLRNEMEKLSWKLKENQKELTSLREKLGVSTVKPGGPFFLQSDFGDLSPSVPPQKFKIKRKWISTPPTPDSLMFTGNLSFGSEVNPVEVNLVAAIEAFENKEKAKSVFEERRKKLAMNVYEDNVFRKKRGAISGMALFDGEKYYRHNLPHNIDSDFEGEVVKLYCHLNSVITVSATYLHPVDRGKLEDIMMDVLKRAQGVVEEALKRAVVGNKVSKLETLYRSMNDFCSSLYPVFPHINYPKNNIWYHMDLAAHY